ncbi:hypothetical protein PPYR_00638 [Photinus pyralis]|uniref:Uncharacterized protein n=1 Tax=Photinus pyralis TaxID=7054 RepID=A0A5N4B2B6_PHOPY|nr:hypothetical protein PPYR_00638 [Photinus pyralis]
MFLRRASVVLIVCFLAIRMGALQRPKTNSRFFFSLFGPTCGSCPQRFCDDDESIVFGYCCGCARVTDRLPVRCPPALRCPINNYELCESYEYMMNCCCSG